MTATAAASDGAGKEGRTGVAVPLWFMDYPHTCGSAPGCRATGVVVLAERPLPHSFSAPLPIRASEVHGGAAPFRA